MKFYLSLIALAFAANFTPDHVSKLQSTREPMASDLEHLHPGCPAYSICSLEMGKKLSLWHKLQKELLATESARKKVFKLKAFHKKFGIPLKHLVDKKTSLNRDSILFQSSCKNHRLKDQQIMVATSFFKRLPKSEKVYFPTMSWKKKTLSYPYESFPLFIHENSVVTQIGEAALGLYLKITHDGLFQFLAPKRATILSAIEKNEMRQCPGQRDKTVFFSATSCKAILNQSTNKAENVEIKYGCL